MSHIKGIGGIFFKSKDPQTLLKWYQERLGLPLEADQTMMFHWREHEKPDNEHLTVWSVMPEDTTYFDPTNSPFMINYIVDDLDACLAELRAQGVEVDDRIDEYEYGRFGWARDLDGNRFELWQPPVYFSSEKK